MRSDLFGFQACLKGETQIAYQSLSKGEEIEIDRLLRSGANQYIVHFLDLMGGALTIEGTSMRALTEKNVKLLIKDYYNGIKGIEVEQGKISVGRLDIIPNRDTLWIQWEK